MLPATKRFATVHEEILQLQNIIKRPDIKDKVRVDILKRFPHMAKPQNREMLQLLVNKFILKMKVKTLWL